MSAAYIFDSKSHLYKVIAIQSALEHITFMVKDATVDDAYASIK